MRNLLNLLAIAVLGSTTAVPNISLNNTLLNSYKTLINLYENINLPIDQIVQEEDTYCVAADIQMIFTFNEISLDHFSQAQIYQDLNGDENGIIVDDQVANYLNAHIPSANYGANHLADNFGSNLQEQWAFQNYVYTSLSHNYPVILGINVSAHAVLISGIQPNYSNPELTRYTFIDPMEANPEPTHFTGQAIPTILRNGGDLIGEGVNPDFKKEEISVGINNREVDENRLNDYEDHEVTRIRTDLTATTGATSTGNFANMIDSISLPNFNSEIYNFTWKKPVKSFSIDANNIPENNDSWLGPKIEIASSSEDNGSAHIEGRIVGQLQFERTKSLNHLLMYLIIYVGGISWSTPNWAHVWFQTGNVLNFSKR